MSQRSFATHADRLRSRLEDRRLPVAGLAARERPAGGRRRRRQSTSTTTSPPASATTGRGSTVACGPCGRATCSWSGSSTTGVATSPIWSTPCTTPVGPRGGPASACRRRSADRHHDRGRPPRVWHLRATLAEFERELIRERTVAGLKAARARGCTEDDEGSTTGPRTR